MPYYAEIVCFSLNTDSAAYLALRRDAIAEVQKSHPKLFAVPFTGADDNGRWVDVWIYETKAAAEAANADAENLAAFGRLFEVLSDVSIESFEVAEEAIGTRL
ncbi:MULTISPECIES: hypothetical protein [unclassified Rhodococcus (in: high G+C Gram-positive bacteria)]|uniref:hypothetical protein n=1 Tax=unclassified Rhodococcus (in: high G+C Gram-positive bacteria) TaxID=192944 RepID=UPI0003734769|nr:hypothetical protein [Rhodococcus sp. DK17]